MHRLRAATCLPIALGLAVLGPALAPVQAGAAANGPCAVTGYDAGTPRAAAQLPEAVEKGVPGVTPTDLFFAHVWSVRPDGFLTVIARSPQPPGRLQAWFALYGVRVPIFDASGGSATQGYSGPWRTADVAPLARRLGAGAASGACSGSAVVEIRESPLLTAAGGGGILLGFFGLLGLTAVAFRRRRLTLDRTTGRARYPASRMLGASALGLVTGSLAGLGEGSWMQQVGTFSPLDARSLAVPAAGAGLGLLAGVLGGRPRLGGAPETAAGAVVGGGPGLLQLVAGATAAAVVSVGSAAVQVAPPPAEVIVPAQAAQVVQNAWTLGRSALAARDSSPDTLGAAFSDEAESMVAGYVQGPAAPHSVNPLSRDLRAVSVYVPHQVSYPASFLAYGSIDTSVGGKPSAEAVYLSFGRAGVAVPWTASTLQVRDVGSLPSILFDRDGYVRATGAGDLVVPPEQLPKLYADYLNAGIRAEAAPAGSVFAPGDGTTGWFQFLSDHRSNALASNHVETQRFIPGSARSYPTAQGALVVFDSTLDYHFEILDPARSDGCSYWPDTAQPPYEPGPHGPSDELPKLQMFAEVPRKPGRSGRAALVSIVGVVTVDLTVIQPPCTPNVGAARRASPSAGR